MEALDFQGLSYYDSKIKDEMIERYEGTIRPISDEIIDEITGITGESQNE